MKKAKKDKPVRSAADLRSLFKKKFPAPAMEGEGEGPVEEADEKVEDTKPKMPARFGKAKMAM